MTSGGGLRQSDIKVRVREQAAAYTCLQSPVAILAESGVCLGRYHEYFKYLALPSPSSNLR
jgi:hypothetical protein